MLQLSMDSNIIPLFQEKLPKPDEAKSLERSEPKIYRYFRAMNHAARHDCGEEIITMQFVGELAMLCEDSMFEMCKIRAKAEKQDLTDPEFEDAKILQENIAAYRTILELHEQHEILIVAEETAREHAEKFIPLS